MQSEVKVDVCITWAALNRLILKSNKRQFVYSQL